MSEAMGGGISEEEGGIFSHQQLLQTGEQMWIKISRNGATGLVCLLPGGTSLLLPAQPFPVLEWRRTKFHHLVLTQPR